MRISALVKENEQIIETYNIKSYLESKRYAIYGAISALEITNEVQKNYVRLLDEEKKIDTLLMQLYGMLQSLFVSVDSLYQLSYELVGSKKFININQNIHMRELKHIRNDVVGHPANRSLRGSGDSYCVLQKDELTSYGFTYLIYSKNGITKRTVNIVDLVEAYYEEANSLLEFLLKVANTTIDNQILIDVAEKVLLEFSDGDYLKELDHLYSLYLKRYPDASKKQHRFVWRYGLVKKIDDFNFKNISKLGLELKQDVIFNELERIYVILSGNDYKRVVNHAKGTLVKSMYRFLRKNKDLYAVKNNLCDFSHPHFYDTYRKFLLRAQKNPTVLEYLHYLEELIDFGDGDLIYAYMSLLKSYKI